MVCRARGRFFSAAAWPVSGSPAVGGAQVGHVDIGLGRARHLVGRHDGAHGGAAGVLLEQVLRAAGEPELLITWGQAARALASQALARLDLEGVPGILALGSSDGGMFEPGQGTEFLNFLARAVERRIILWLRD